jgi:hypothetical protein
MHFSLVGLLLVVLLPPPVLGRQNSQPQVPDSPRGFNKQYQSVFKAYEKGDEQELAARFRTFAIPERWFGDVFGPEQGPKLANQYRELFRGFVTTTTGEFRSVAFAFMDSARVHTKVWKNETQIDPAPKPAPTSLVPLPAIQHFQIRYQSGPYIDRDYPAAPYGTASAAIINSITPGHDNSWVDSFIYVDGAFRFFGGDAYPFWDPCSRNGPLPGGQLVKRVEPLYPQVAGEKQVGGLW